MNGTKKKKKRTGEEKERNDFLEENCDRLRIIFFKSLIS